MQNTASSAAQEFLKGRFIASLGTENEDGSIHLTAVWYLFEGNCLYVATSSRSRKARNVLSRPKASLMVDSRKPGSEQGVVALGSAAVLTGDSPREINTRIHRRYMSEVALARPDVGGKMAALDDVTIKLSPANWYAWDMGELDAAVFGGALKTPGYLLPLDG